MTETVATESPITRAYFRPDYERMADLLRRMRTGKSAAQVARINETIATMVGLFSDDNPEFTPEPFMRACLRRIETVDNAEFVTWAEANGVDPSEPTANESAFYAAKLAAQYEADEDAEDEDAEDE